MDTSSFPSLLTFVVFPWCCIMAGAHAWRTERCAAKFTPATSRATSAGGGVEAFDLGAAAAAAAGQRGHGLLQAEVFNDGGGA
jgi:hypothetical protein